MKQLVYSILAACLIALTGCDEMLDTTNYTKYDTSTFPVSQKDAEQIVTSIYNRLGPIYKNPEEAAILISGLASDEMFGGGSTSNDGAQGIDRLMYKSTEGFENAWTRFFQGIFRANYALGEIPDMDDKLFDSAEWKDYLIGQAHFLRAWFYWSLADLFETFPLLTSTEPVNEPRSDAESIFQAITNDLLDAIKLMPAKYGYTREDGLSGRATKYAAEALLARIWMFYTGFYSKSDMFGVSKNDVISYLKDCRDNSKFGLVSDPRTIWPYTNDYSSGYNFDTDFGTYASQNHLHWVGNHSQETVWACHFSMVTQDISYNRIGEYCGLRNKASSPDKYCYPYGIGYTNGTVNPKMVEDWATDPDYGYDDVRLWGSVLSVDNAGEIYGGGEGGDWLAGQPIELESHKGNDSKEVEKTMFHNKKYIVSTTYADASKKQIFKNFFYAYDGFSGSNSNQYDNRNDAIYIRFADVLLMLDELEGTVTGMNKLRARAGLKPYDSYSLERLQKERRYELAFEGVRFDDLRRWYPKNAGQVISDNQKGAFIEYRGKSVPGGYAEISGNGLQKRYEETRGFWRIPNTQITLSQDVLVQTPGWEDDNPNKWMFTNGNLPYNVN